MHGDLTSGVDVGNDQAMKKNMTRLRHDLPHDLNHTDLLEKDQKIIRMRRGCAGLQGERET